uniref:S9 family peptidase n=1 Tax=Candidatus Aschnera chinzeii TaxID=1485666 RepID=A0AAT9G4H5_9ENTR|nr:MAG: S9 family peptidase [Candidatus Aschnera chinzeii]
MVMNIPKAKKKLHKIIVHNDVRIDQYHWLRDDTRSNMDVINYLTQENVYTQNVLSLGSTLYKQVYNEIYNRIEQKDKSISYISNGYVYRTIYYGTQEYPIYQRKLMKKGSIWEDLLDINNRAKNYKFYSLHTLVISENNKYLAISEDYIGNNQYNISFQNINTGEWNNNVINNTSGDIVWTNNSSGIFYIRNHPITLLSYQVYLHFLDTNNIKDKQIYQEYDSLFSICLQKSTSKKYIFIVITSKKTSEYRLIDANNYYEKNKIFLLRRDGHKYYLDHFLNFFYIRSNCDSENYGLYYIKNMCDVWNVLIKPKKNIYLEKFILFKYCLIIKERSNGLVYFRQIIFHNKQEFIISFNEPIYFLDHVHNFDDNSKYLFYCYSSFITPFSIFKIHIFTRKKKLLKQQKVNGYNSKDYISKRIWIKSDDGVKIPVSLVYRKKLWKKYTNPILLYGYGAYGISVDVVFSAARLSLLDRGFVYAIIHVRGGGDLGKAWYNSGKVKYKINTFNDFICVTKKLIQNGYCAYNKVYAIGASAGGLLMGAIINHSPQLYRGVIAQVPFVDVLSTMLDSNLPLTTIEYEEWGNPNEEDIYFLLKSYSPYDNIKQQRYPNLLVTAALYDYQVSYWEPVKWVAKLREYKIGNSLLLLKTNMYAGHCGASGRFAKVEDIALQYTFLLMLENHKKYFIDFDI